MQKLKDMTVYLSLEEHQMLKAKADRAGMSVSSYVRGLLNVPRLRPGIPIQFYQLMEELRKIGNNMNQIAAIANSTHDVNAGQYTEYAKMQEDKVAELERNVLFPEAREG